MAAPSLEVNTAEQYGQAKTGAGFVVHLAGRIAGRYLTPGPPRVVGTTCRLGSDEHSCLSYCVVRFN